MSGFHSDDGITFYNVPVGLKATLVTFSLVNGVPYYAAKDIMIRKGQAENMELFKTTLTALKEDLKKLN